MPFATKAEKNAYHRKWRSENRHRCRAYHIKCRFGVTSEKAQDLADKARDGVCEVCGGRDSYRYLNVDHRKSDGVIRGVLCHNCNIILGLAKESPGVLRRLIAYLDAS